jgi:hypothetical protein
MNEYRKKKLRRLRTGLKAIQELRFELNDVQGSDELCHLLKESAGRMHGLIDAYSEEPVNA